MIQTKKGGGNRFRKRSPRGKKLSGSGGRDGGLLVPKHEREREPNGLFARDDRRELGGAFGLGFGGQVEQSLFEVDFASAFSPERIGREEIKAASGSQKADGLVAVARHGSEGAVLGNGNVGAAGQDQNGQKH